MSNVKKLVGPALVAVLAVVGPVIAQTSEEETHRHHHGMMAEGMHSGEMPAACQQMQDMHQKMMQKREMLDSRLSELVAAMNAATGDAKVTAMSAVINELVAQRTKMDEMMQKAQPMMMHHMMGHMQSGGMGDCPMMKEHMEKSMTDKDTMMKEKEMHEKKMMQEKEGGGSSMR